MFVRLYSGDDGQSHFEELDRAEGPALFSKVQSASAIFFRNDCPDRILRWHTAPRRQYVITLSGSVDIRIGDGTVKTLVPGDVLLAEDLTGQGHTAVPKGTWTRAYIPIDDFPRESAPFARGGSA